MTSDVWNDGDVSVWCHCVLSAEKVGDSLCVRDCRSAEFGDVVVWGEAWPTVYCSVGLVGVHGHFDAGCYVSAADEVSLDRELVVFESCVLAMTSCEASEGLPGSSSWVSVCVVCEFDGVVFVFVVGMGVGLTASHADDDFD